MKIAMYQMQMSKNTSENLEKSLCALREAAAEGADLIVYPELTLLPFFPQYEAQDMTDAVIHSGAAEIEAFRLACRENKIYAVPNFYYEENGEKYDASFVITPEGEILGIQKMVHIAQAEQFYEQDYYAPSDDGFLVFDTPLGKIGIVVCFDRHYPESIRTEKLKGADLVLIPTANTKAEPLDMFEWEIRVQAFQNCVPVAMCNRIGTEGDMEFAGESLVTDVNGDLLVKADDSEQIVYAEIDPEESKKNRRPYLSLRRTDLYE